MRRTNSGLYGRLAALMLSLCVSGFVATSCSGFNDCTDVSYVSIFASLVDETGADLEYDFDDAVVEYRDRAEGEWRPCTEDFEETWVCAGWDNPGVYDVRATVGELSGMVTDIRVPQDRDGGCHITSQSVDVVMQ